MFDHRPYNSEDILLQVSLGTGVVVFAADADGCWRHLCPTWETLTGWGADDTLHKKLESFIHPYDHAAWTEAFAEVASGRKAIRQIDARVCVRSGAYVWVEARLKACCGMDGRHAGVIGTLVDATERKRLEILSRGERSVMEAIARGARLEDALGIICNVYEQQVDRSRCSVHLVSSDGQHLHHGAGPRLPETYRAAIDRLRIGPEVVSCGTAAYTGRAVIASDIATDHRWADFRDTAMSHGLRACWSFPFKAASGSVKGTFAVYRDEPSQPEAWEQDLAVRLANVAVIAIASQEVAEKLRQSDERYVLAVRAAGVGLWDIDLVHRTVFWSPRHKEIFGLWDGDDPSLDEPQDLEIRQDRLGHTLEQAIHPDDLPRVQQAYSAHLEHGAPYDIEFRIRRRGQNIRWVHAKAEAVRDTTGRAIRVAGSVVDITERVAADTRLRDSEQRFHDFAHAASDWMWEMGADLRFTSLSDRGTTGLDMNLSDILGKTCWEISTESIEQPKWAALLSDLRAHRPFRDFEYVHHRHDGDVRVFRFSGIPVFSPGGEFAGYRGTGTDATRERTAEEALRVRERQLSEAQRIAKMGDWLLHVGTQTVSCSDEVLRIFGVSRERFEGQFSSFMAAVHPDDREILRHSLDRLIADRTSCDFRCRIIQPCGETRYIWLEGQCRLTETGDVSDVFGICQDITEQRQVEQTLRAARDTAQRASRAKSAFLAAMSHELRTPLNAIIGFSDLLAAEYGEAIGERTFREYLRDIGQSGRHLLGLINDILDVAKIEAGHLELNEDAVDVGRVLDEAIRLTQHATGAGAHQVHVQVPSPAPMLLADPRRLKQVLINLLSNAFKFTPESGRIAVTVAVGEDSLDIIVADTGIGIPAERMPEVGMPFTQFNDAHSRRYAGTGLGLHIAKVLVEQHGGSLDVDSQPDVGTAVTVRLPRTRLTTIRELLAG